MTEETFVPVLGLDAPIGRNDRELCALIHVELIGREIIVRNDFSFHAPSPQWATGVAKRAHEYKARLIAPQSIGTFDDYVRTVLARAGSEAPLKFVRPKIDIRIVAAMEDSGRLLFARDGLDYLRNEIAEGRGDRYDAFRAALTALVDYAPPARLSRANRDRDTSTENDAGGSEG